jgi:hypothetical protein
MKPGGYEVKPNISLSEYFERRAAGAANGTPYNKPIILNLSGTANGKSPLYKWDKNDFQPRFAVAWSPNFGKIERLEGLKKTVWVGCSAEIMNRFFAAVWPSRMTI